MAFIRRPSHQRGPQAPQKSLPPWAAGALLGVFVLATGLSGYIVYGVVKDLVANSKLPGASSPTVSESAVGEYENTTTGNASEEESSANESSSAWSGSARLTVLVMGIDQRAGLESETAYRTDSLLLLTLDPVGKMAGMLSIPRDLWVQIPGFEGRSRINTANFKGDSYRLPGGGPALAMETVAMNLGVRVDYYVRINFTAFEALIDEIGGVDIDVAETIDDPTYPDCCFGYNPFYIETGWQHLDGRTALKYARTRVTFGGDFDRAIRQQQLVLGVRNKLLDLNMLPTLISHAPKLYSTLAGSFDTNLTLDQMVSLAWLTKEVKRENIQMATIDADYILNEFTTANGAQVVVLDATAFRVLREKMFYMPAPVALSTIDPEKLAIEEAATIEVQNGAARAGIAKGTADYLTRNGFTVVSIGNADRLDYETTIIYDYTGRYYTTRWLAEHFNVQPSRIIARNDPNSPVDVRVIVGKDLVLP